MTDVFISYAHEDHDYVRHMAPAFEAEGLTVWWDHSIPPGKTWDEVIAKGIADARCCVVLWSRHSVISDWVKEEATIAKDQKKFIPVQIDNSEPPVGFRRIQAAHLQNWRGDKSDQQWQMLVREVRGVISASRASGAPSGAPPARHAPSYSAPPAYPQRADGERKSPWPLLAGLAIAVALVAAVFAMRPWEQGSEPEKQQTQVETPARDVEAEIQAARQEERERAAAEMADRERQLREQGLAEQAARERAQREQAERERRQREAARDTGPYGLDLLHPQVRQAVVAARAAESRAVAAAARARDAAARAQAAGVNAPTQGYGTETYTGDWQGDRYAGQFSGGERNGIGVMNIAINGANTYNAARYEGEWYDDLRHGDGVFYWRDGRRHAGEFRRDYQNGHGIFYMSDGRRYDGEWETVQSGYGVLWDAQGRVSQQGIWADGSLSRALSP